MTTAMRTVYAQSSDIRIGDGAAGCWSTETAT